MTTTTTTAPVSDRAAVAGLLRAARALIAESERWCKGSIAMTVGYDRTMDDQDFRALPREAFRSFCASGALIAAAYWAPLDERWNWRVIEKAADALRLAVPASVADCGLGTVEVFNDWPDVQHSDVLAVFDHAIVLMESGEI